VKEKELIEAMRSLDNFDDSIKPSEVDWEKWDLFLEEGAKKLNCKKEDLIILINPNNGYSVELLIEK